MHVIIPKRNIWGETMQKYIYAKKPTEELKKKTRRNLLTQKKAGKEEQRNFKKAYETSRQQITQ